MRTKLQSLLSFTALLTGLSTASAQQSGNIYVNNFLVSDLHEAASNFGFDGAVIVGDTIFIDSEITFQGLSLILLCNHLVAKENVVTLLPFKKDSSTYKADGKGVEGLNVQIFSKSAVKGAFKLPGGDGMPGAKGHDGRSGVKPNTPDECCTDRNKGLQGRDGQNGFPGGNGGKLSLMTVSQNPSDVRITGKGGKGGAGGSGGHGGKTYRKNNRPVRAGDAGNPGSGVLPYIISQEDSGNPGITGQSGSSAKIVLKRITKDDFRKELHKYGIDSVGSRSGGFTTLVNTKTPGWGH